MKSKWADDEQDAAEAAQRKAEKAEKKRAKAEKQRQQEEEQARRQQAIDAQAGHDGSEGRPSKRRRLSQDGQAAGTTDATPLLRFNPPGWAPSRSVDNYKILNPIEEGTYGIVSRAQCSTSGAIVALKKMKPGLSGDEGFPVTALREIQTLQSMRHRNIIELIEVVTESSSEKDPAADPVYLVMEFAEHDLKALIDEMPEPFLPSEIKTLMLQLTSAVEFLHDNWIMHRDLKTSNILLTNGGRLKLADFGLARVTSSPPPPNLTRVVVSLWYRSPELLLGAKTYDFAIDIWSLGCVFGELLSKEVLLPGLSEVNQLAKTFVLVGYPNETIWPGYRRLPHAKALPAKLRATIDRKGSSLRTFIEKKSPQFTPAGYELLKSLLSLDPEQRPSAKQVLGSRYFSEDPRPKAEQLMPSFPSKAGLEKRRRRETPNAPARDQGAGKTPDFSSLSLNPSAEAGDAGFG